MDVMFHKDAFKSLEPNWFKDLRTEIRWFFKNIKRVFEYFPVVWNDRDWDHTYLYQMMKYKISRHRKDMENDKWHTKAKQRAKQMRTCELLLDRLAKDDYWENTEKKREKRWGELKIDFLDPEPGECYGKLDISRPKCLTEEDKELERKQIRWDVEHDNMQRKQDLELFAKIFTRSSQGWWT